MFVAMGLSALAPVFHGISLYGLAQTRNQIGLFWLLLQGVLYITGATLYAVSLCQSDLYSMPDPEISCVGRNVYILAASICWARHTRFFTCSSFLRPHHTSKAYWRRLTTAIASQALSVCRKVKKIHNFRSELLKTFFACELAAICSARSSFCACDLSDLSSNMVAKMVIEDRGADPCMTSPSRIS